MLLASCPLQSHKHHYLAKILYPLSILRLNGFALADSFPLLHPGIYSCPVYYYPNRAGNSDRASFVVAADLKSGQMSAEHWVKRGTALLMSLDH